LQDMVRLKRSIVERARQAVVLNADYATCLAMLPLQAGVQLYLASLSQAQGSLLGSDHRPDWVCTVEPVAGGEWIVLYARTGERLPVIASAAIPATFDGAARMNVSNAQHAICAGHALGIPLECMQEALVAFEADFTTTPGRLNIRRDLPFTVVMDYVHNIDGMGRVAEFLSSLPVSGRRIVMFAVPGDRLDAEVADYTRSAVGRFDHYICRSYPNLRGRQPGEIPRLMRRVLLAAGVPDERITVEPDPALAIRHTLQMARPGDLVLLATAEIEAMWEAVTSFRYGDSSDPPNP
jgi:cyanophycin synthetase